MKSNSSRPNPTPRPPHTRIAGMRVDAGTYETATAQVIAWAQRRESRYVCVANVHMVMESHDSPEFREIVNQADLVTSDGMPLVWVLRRRGHRTARRVYGPTLMLEVCAAAARTGVSIALFGGTEKILGELAARLHKDYPSLQITATIAPPFASFTREQNAEFARKLKESRAQIIFVGLGCPKQERWMAEVSRQIPAPLLGVGAAFNFHAGYVPQSPRWLQMVGLEWLFRFAMEPKRLWRRYAVHNPRFIWQVLKEEFSGPAAS